MVRLRRLARGVARLAGGVQWGLVSGATGLLVLIAVLLALIVYVPQQAVDPRGLTRDQWLTHVQDLRTTILQGLGGLAVLAGAVVASLSLRETSRRTGPSRGRTGPCLSCSAGARPPSASPEPSSSSDSKAPRSWTSGWAPSSP